MVVDVRFAVSQGKVLCISYPKSAHAFYVQLQEKINPNVTDASMAGGSTGATISGGALFRKYLLNRCQEDYEKGWKEKETATTITKAGEEEAKKKASEKEKTAAEKGEKIPEPKEGEPKEAELMSDEYYAAQKAKRRGLGLVRFIGELYKLTMLTGRIMHECIRQMLSNVQDPDEEDMESLCRLLTTIGQQLENEPMRDGKSKAVMDIYFQRLSVICTSDKVNSRIRFMVQVSQTACDHINLC